MRAKFTVLGGRAEEPPHTLFAIHGPRLMQFIKKRDRLGGQEKGEGIKFKPLRTLLTGVKISKDHHISVKQGLPFRSWKKSSLRNLFLAEPLPSDLSHPEKAENVLIALKVPPKEGKAPKYAFLKIPVSAKIGGNPVVFTLRNITGNEAKTVDGLKKTLWGKRLGSEGREFFTKEIDRIIEELK